MKPLGHLYTGVSTENYVWRNVGNWRMSVDFSWWQKYLTQVLHNVELFFYWYQNICIDIFIIVYIIIHYKIRLMFIYMSTFCLHQTSSQNKAQTKTKYQNKTQTKQKLQMLSKTIVITHSSNLDLMVLSGLWISFVLAKLCFVMWTKVEKFYVATMCYANQWEF